MVGDYCAIYNKQLKSKAGRHYHSKRHKELVQIENLRKELVSKITNYAEEYGPIKALKDKVNQLKVKDLPRLINTINTKINTKVVSDLLNIHYKPVAESVSNKAKMELVRRGYQIIHTNSFQNIANVYEIRFTDSFTDTIQGGEVTAGNYTKLLNAIRPAITELILQEVRNHPIKVTILAQPVLYKFSIQSLIDGTFLTANDPTNYGKASKITLILNTQGVRRAVTSMYKILERLIEELNEKGSDIVYFSIKLIYIKIRRY